MSKTQHTLQNWDESKPSSIDCEIDVRTDRIYLKFPNEEGGEGRCIWIEKNGAAITVHAYDDESEDNNGSPVNIHILPDAIILDAHDRTDGEFGEVIL